jgi:hypothetical protein
MRLMSLLVLIMTDDVGGAGSNTIITTTCSDSCSYNPWRQNIIEAEARLKATASHSELLHDVPWPP